MQGGRKYNGLRSWRKKEIGPLKKQIELSTAMSGLQEQKSEMRLEELTINVPWCHFKVGRNKVFTWFYMYSVKNITITLANYWLSFYKTKKTFLKLPGRIYHYKFSATLWFYFLTVILLSNNLSRYRFVLDSMLDVDIQR